MPFDASPYLNMSLKDKWLLFTAPGSPLQYLGSHKPEPKFYFQKCIKELSKKPRKSFSPHDYEIALPLAREVLGRREGKDLAYPDLARMGGENPAIRDGLVLLYCVAGKKARKNNPSLLIAEHSVRVADSFIYLYNALFSCDPTENEVLLALHHDTEEDFGLTREQLAIFLNQRVAFLVHGVTVSERVKNAGASTIASLTEQEALLEEKLLLVEDPLEEEELRRQQKALLGKSMNIHLLRLGLKHTSCKIPDVQKHNSSQCFLRLVDNLENLYSVARDIYMERVDSTENGRGSTDYLLAEFAWRLTYNDALADRLVTIQDDTAMNPRELNLEKAAKLVSLITDRYCKIYTSTTHVSVPHKVAELHNERDRREILKLLVKQLPEQAFGTSFRKIMADLHI